MSNKNEVKIIKYDINSINQAIQLLNSISVTGISQASILCNIVQILNTPIQEAEKEKTE